MPDVSSVRGWFHLIGLDHSHQRRSHLQFEHTAVDEASDAARIDLAGAGLDIDIPPLNEGTIRPSPFGVVTPFTPRRWIGVQAENIRRSHSGVSYALDHPSAQPKLGVQGAAKDVDHTQQAERMLVEERRELSAVAGSPLRWITTNQE
jgi:hypothetical protein